MKVAIRWNALAAIMNSAGYAWRDTPPITMLCIISLAALEWGSVQLHINFLGVGVNEKNWWDNKCIKCIGFTFSCLVGAFAIVLIVFFFLTLGCAYEFVKCYLDKKFEKNNDDSWNDYEKDLPEHFDEEQNDADKCSFLKVVMCIFLAALGFACQPLYLLFYILYGMMECYRRFGCWAMVG